MNLNDKEKELETQNKVNDFLTSGEIIFELLDTHSSANESVIKELLESKLNCQPTKFNVKNNLLFIKVDKLNVKLLNNIKETFSVDELHNCNIKFIQEIINHKKECIYNHTPTISFEEPNMVDISVIQMKEITSKIEVLFLTVNPWEKKALLAEMKPINGKNGLLRGKIEQQIYRVGSFGNYLVSHVESTIGSQGRRGSTTTLATASHEFPNLKIVILIGIAFGLDNKKQRLGDVLIADSIFPYEYQKITPESSVQRGQEILCGDTLSHCFASLRDDWKLPLYGTRTVNVYQGQVLSGEKLVNDPDFIADLIKQFPTALGGEMEAAGGYAVIRPPKEIILVKGICDWGINKNDDAQPFAAFAAVSLTKHILSKPDSLHPLISTKATPHTKMKKQLLAKKNNSNVASIKERLNLINKLNGLSATILDNFITFIKPTSGIISPVTAPPAQRTSDLINWAESGLGIGLNQLQDNLETFLNSLNP